MWRTDVLQHWGWRFGVLRYCPDDVLEMHGDRVAGDRGLEAVKSTLCRSLTSMPASQTISA